MNLEQITNENQLFIYLKQFDLNMTRTGKYDSNDIWSPKYEAAIEMKVRHHIYNNDLLIIEEDKYQFLKQFKRAFYICKTHDGIYSFNVHEHQLNFFEKDLPKSTEFKNQYFIPKRIAYFSKKMCRKI